MKKPTSATDNIAAQLAALEAEQAKLLEPQRRLEALQLERQRLEEERGLIQLADQVDALNSATSAAVAEFEQAMAALDQAVRDLEPLMFRSEEAAQAVYARGQERNHLVETNRHIREGVEVPDGRVARLVAYQGISGAFSVQGHTTGKLNAQFSEMNYQRQQAHQRPAPAPSYVEPEPSPLEPMFDENGKPVLDAVGYQLHHPRKPEHARPVTCS